MTVEPRNPGQPEKANEQRDLRQPHMPISKATPTAREAVMNLTKHIRAEKDILLRIDRISAKIAVLRRLVDASGVRIVNEYQRISSDATCSSQEVHT